MKKLLALILAIALCASLAACGGGKPSKEETPTTPDSSTNTEVTPADPEVEYKETVWINIGSELTSADPYQQTSGEAEVFTNLTFNTVIYLHPETNEIMPELAYKWEPSADNVEWTFYLEEGVTFHNGNSFGADDVKFTWEYAGTGQNNVLKPIAAYDYVKDIEVVDEHTVKFILKNGMPDFATYLETKIYDKESFDTMPAEEAGVIGTGPYYYDAEQDIPGQQYVATRYDNYWGGIENHPTKYIGFKCILEGDAKMNALQTGQLDVYGVGQVSYLPTVEADPNLVAHIRPSTMIYHLGFNFRNPVLADLEVRRAISQAINKQDIEMIFWEGGTGGTAHDNFCPPGGLGYSDDIKTLGYDPDAARAVLEPMNLSLRLAVYPANQKLGEVIQACLTNVGVNVDLTIVPDAWGAFKLAGDFDMIAEYGSYAGAMLYNFTRFMKTDAPSNPYKYSSAEFDSLLADCSAASTYDDLLDRFEVLQQYVADEIPYFPLGVSNLLLFAHKDVEGIQMATTVNGYDFSCVRVPVAK